MLDKINTLFSSSTDKLELVDRKPLQLDELQTLIRMTAECGYSVKDAHDMTAPYGVISSELYAVWHSIENEIPIFSDNIDHLITLTGWERSRSPVLDTCINQDVNAVDAA